MCPSLLAGVGLRALPPLSALATDPFPELRRLVAGHNQLDGTALVVLAALPALQQLALTDNRICSVPPLDGAPAFLRLDTLDLSRNRLCDVASVQRLQALPSLQRLLLEGNPVVAAGPGADAAKLAALHSHSAQQRGSIIMLGSVAADGVLARPARPQGRQFVGVEEASVVRLKAKAFTQQRRASAGASAIPSASNAADVAAAAGASLAAPGELPPLHADAPDAADASDAVTGGAEKGADAPAAFNSMDGARPAPAATNTTAASAAATAAASGRDGSSGDVAAVGAFRLAAAIPHHTAACHSFLDWELAGEENALWVEDSGDCLPSTDPHARLWSTQSVVGTAASTCESLSAAILEAL